MPTSKQQMQGKICLVTGANSGIGKVTALELARMGATVVMVCRDRTKGEVAQREIKAQSGNALVDLLLADLSSPASIRQLIEDFKQRYTHLHVLINNAGIVTLRRRETASGVEMMLAVNYLAPFLLTNLLLDVLKGSGSARIINVSSEAHEAGYINMDDLQSKEKFRFMRAYGQSKLAVVLFTNKLARKLEGTGVTANSLHPGFVATNIGQSGLGPVGRFLAKTIFLMGSSPEKGAQTSLYLATSADIEGVTGKYFEKSVPKQPAEIAASESLQEQLWIKSVELLHLSVMV